MDFRLTDEQARFQREVREWLLANLPAGWGTAACPKPETPADKVAFMRNGIRKLNEGGWAGLHWPKEYGGRGATPIEQFLFAEEYTRLGAPSMIDYGVGPGLAARRSSITAPRSRRSASLPTILMATRCGARASRSRTPARTSRTVRTRADLDGDEFRVNGQKIWTSYARYADWCILIVRTDPNAAKHKGLTFLLRRHEDAGHHDPAARGDDGRRLVQRGVLRRRPHPAANMIGRLNEGWTIAITTLSHERAGSAPHSRIAAELTDMIEVARGLSRGGKPVTADPLVRQRLAQAYIESDIVRLVAWRQVSEMMRRGQPGPEGSYLKLLWSEMDMRMKELGIELEGPYAVIDRGSPQAIDGGRWQYEYLWSRAASIYAGTSEVQRNIIAQRVLGLPRG
jgi:alkylation response protein AidB-like acyl-CoA dehydrogenase